MPHPRTESLEEPTFLLDQQSSQDLCTTAGQECEGTESLNVVAFQRVVKF